MKDLGKGIATVGFMGFLALAHIYHIIHPLALVFIIIFGLALIWDR